MYIHSKYIYICIYIYIYVNIYDCVRNRAADPTCSASKIDSGRKCWPDSGKEKYIGYLLDIFDIRDIYQIYCTYNTSPAKWIYETKKAQAAGGRVKFEIVMENPLEKSRF